MSKFFCLYKKIRNDSSFSNLRKNSGSTARLDEVEKHFMPKENELFMALNFIIAFLLPQENRLNSGSDTTFFLDIVIDI